MDADKGEVGATAKGNMLTSLLKAVGIRNIGFGSSATVRKGRGTVEVALVLTIPDRWRVNPFPT